MSINDIIVVKEPGVIFPDNVPFVMFIIRTSTIGENTLLETTNAR
jgi:hypothetical protein